MPGSAAGGAVSPGIPGFVAAPGVPVGLCAVVATLGFIEANNSLALLGIAFGTLNIGAVGAAGTEDVAAGSGIPGGAIGCPFRGAVLFSSASCLSRAFSRACSAESSLFKWVSHRATQMATKQSC